ncbi:MAG: Ig-like domain-containing protein [Deltaproteobacteria bacterium]|nr:Ig-like domain-containing protein [Deltaproteobacteria bacterium]MCB9786197.1 Ig-like domain-containing protein [Deltaproteobacteria bacterium]
MKLQRATLPLVLLTAALAACTSGDSPGPTRVDELPKVVIAEPAQGSVVSVPLVDVRGTVDDDSGIVALAYTLNGGAERSVPQDIGRTGPYAFQVTLVRGANTLTVVADDVSGNRGSATVSVTYATPPPKDAEKPKVSITEPLDGAVLDEGSVEFAGTATDDVGVVRLTVLGGDGVERDVSKKLVDGAFRFALDLVPGPQTVFVFAYDAAGNRTARERKVTWDVPPVAVATLRVDPDQTGQTWFGAGATADAGQDGCEVFEASIDGALALAADGLGVSWLRVPLRGGVEGARDWYASFQAGEITYEELVAHRAQGENDDDDPQHAEATRFQFTELDDTMTRVVLPLRALVPELRVVLSVELAPGDAEAFSPLDSPDEYAELVAVAVEHLVTTHGVTPDVVDALWQADGHPATVQAVVDAVAAADARLQTAGHVVDWWLPSATTAGAAVTWAEKLPARLPVPPALLTHAGATEEQGEPPAPETVTALAAGLGAWPGMVDAGPDRVELLLDRMADQDYAAWSLGRLAVCEPTTPGGWLWLDDGTGVLPAAGASAEARLLGRAVLSLPPGAVRVGLAVEGAGAGLHPVAFRLPAGGTAVLLAHDGPGLVGVAGLDAGSYTRRLYDAEAQGLGAESVALAEGETLWLQLSEPGLAVVVSDLATP